MPLRISLLLFFCFKMLMGFGFSVIPFTDSTTGKKHQLTREAFLNRYGTDDSSRALIHYFFDKRQVAQKKAITRAGIAAGAGILFALLVMSNIFQGNLLLIIAAIGLGSAFWVFLLFGIFSGIVLYSFSRKRLLRLLQAYQQGKPLPKKITRQLPFKMHLRHR